MWENAYQKIWNTDTFHAVFTIIYIFCILNKLNYARSTILNIPYYNILYWKFKRKMFCNSDHNSYSKKYWIAP